jgi:hypothetical protein
VIFVIAALSFYGQLKERNGLSHPAIQFGAVPIADQSDCEIVLNVVGN